MAEHIESESFSSGTQVKQNISETLKPAHRIKGVEFLLKGDSLEGSKEFGELLLRLRKQGVKISHEFSIKLDFPGTISRDRALELVESMPNAKNGSLKVRLELGSVPAGVK
jgi:hypothetical protein